MTSRSIQVRAAGPADIPGLVRLFQRHYAQHKPAAYFAWQFFAPEMPAALIVAEADGEVVGSFGFMKRALTHGLRAAQAMDMLLDEPFRGQGLFARMAAQAAAAFPEVDVRLVLANRAGMAAVTRRLGWSVVAQVPVYAASLADATGMPVSPAPIEAESGAESLRIWYDEIVEAWRFAAHPVNRYHRLEASGLRGHLKCFADPGDPSRRFGDIMRVAPGNSGQREAWLRCALDWFRAEGVGECGLWSLPGNPLAETALRIGFRPRAQERWLCAQFPGAGAGEALRTGRWDVCAADAEFY